MRHTIFLSDFVSALISRMVSTLVRVYRPRVGLRPAFPPCILQRPLGIAGCRHVEPVVRLNAPHRWVVLQGPRHGITIFRLAGAGAAGRRRDISNNRLSSGRDSHMPDGHDSSTAGPQSLDR